MKEAEAEVKLEIVMKEEELKKLYDVLRALRALKQDMRKVLGKEK